MYINFQILELDVNQNKQKMSDRKAVIKNADMSEEMQQDAVDCATQVWTAFYLKLQW